MQNVLDQTGGLIFLFLFGAVMVALTAWVGRGRRRDNAEFLLAGRNVGVLTGAMSIAASWIWAPALFIASQKAYEQGIAGLFWFTFPNVMALVVFAPLALRIRERFPSGYTLPQFMGNRHGRGVHILYLIQFFGLQICSFAVQILAGSALIETMTGLPFLLVATILVGTALLYSVMGGIRASLTTDFLQMALILTISAIAVSWAVVRAGGLSIVAEGLGGHSGDGNLFDPWVAYSFGIPVTIGLLSGPIGDQMHWQRAYALRSNSDVIKTFLLGAALFIVVPLSLSLLGFVAANDEVSRRLDGYQQPIDRSHRRLPAFASVHDSGLQRYAAVRPLFDPRLRTLCDVVSLFSSLGRLGQRGSDRRARHWKSKHRSREHVSNGGNRPWNSLNTQPANRAPFPFLWHMASVNDDSHRSFAILGSVEQQSCIYSNPDLVDTWRTHLCRRGAT